MGKYAQIALPIAAAIVAPYAAGALATSSAVGATATANAAGMANTALSGSFFVPAVAPTAASMSPWLVAANAGMTGFSQLGALQQQRSQAAAARAQNDAERARTQRDYEIAERKRRVDLRQALAQQRARFGASGISSAGGSAEAVLKGLEKQTDDASRDHLGSIRQQSATRNKINLLEESSTRKRGQFLTFQKTISPLVRLLED